MIRVFNHYIHKQALLSILFDLGLIAAAVLAGVLLQGDRMGTFVPMAGPQFVSLAAGLFLINTASGFYESSHNRSLTQSLTRASFVLLLALPLTYAIFAFIPSSLGGTSWLPYAAMGGVAAVVARRVYISHWGTATRRRSRVLVFGSGTAAELVASTLQANDAYSEIVGFYPGPNEKETAVPAAKLLPTELPLTQTARNMGVDEIVVAITERRAGSMPLRQLLDCKIFGIKVYDITSHFEKSMGQIRVDFVNAGWLIFGDGFNQGLWRTAIKRASDLVGALILILVSAPIMLVAALAIKLESRGPLFYRQERTGLNGAPFMVTKFRSMRQDAEQDGKPRWATLQDDRVTRVGHIIRKLRIDELPQLFNVLKGEMSLVGPRPERPFFVDQLTKEIPYYAVRHSVKPGVTGWAQVRYQYGSTVEDSMQKLQYDLYYVKNHTLFLDLVILVETVGVVLTGKGAR